MRVVTTFSQKLYDHYAYRVVETFENWPEEAKLIIYSEDMTQGDTDRVEWRKMDFPDLESFKSRCQPTNNYMYDAARFAHKMWAMIHGSWDAEGLCFWLDADCVTHRKPSAEFLNRLIPPQYYFGYFGRTNLYTETGFWGVRANHECHKPFMSALKNTYMSGEIFGLPWWTDCHVLDHVRNKLSPPSINLSGEFSKATHPMALHQIGKYIDHCKGKRKEKGISPENRWRK